jgi:thiamine monophosphate synthase
MSGIRRAPVSDGRLHRRARRAAARLARIAGRLSPGARLFLLTDPVRSPDPAWLAAAAPRGAVVVWRSFGASVTPAIRRARRLAARRGVLFAVSADIAAARALRADGLHLPEWARPARSAIGRSGARFVTRSAEAVFHSAVFASSSPSAGAPMGPVRWAIAARRLRRPVAVALGGVTARTARRLAGAPLAGLAAVSLGP